MLLLLVLLLAALFVLDRADGAESETWSLLAPISLIGLVYSLITDCSFRFCTLGGEEDLS